MAKNNEARGTAAARESSKATLEEQSKMRPDPSQDGADAIKLGQPSEEEVEQPSKGPAAEAEADAVEAREAAAKLISEGAAARPSRG